MANIRSLKILCARSIGRNRLPFQLNEIPCDLHPFIERFQHKIYQGDKVLCPKCKECTLTLVDGDECDHNLGEHIEWASYFFWQGRRPWINDDDAFVFHCRNCNIVCMTCPKCSIYGGCSNLVLSESQFVLLKYLGFHADSSESLPPRPNRRPNKSDLEYDKKRTVEDYNGAPILPVDDVDDIETEAAFEYIDYYRGHEHRQYATEVDMSSGHSGGETIYWRCEFCDYLVEVTDK